MLQYITITITCYINLDISTFVVSISSSLSIIGRAPSTSGMFSSTHFNGSNSGSAPRRVNKIVVKLRDRWSRLTFWGLRSGGLGSSHLETLPGVTVENVLLLLVTGVVLLPVQQRSEGVPLVVLAGAPQDHDNTEDDGEEKMPECLQPIHRYNQHHSASRTHLIYPEVSPLGETLHSPVVLDAPEHEDDAVDDAEDQRVGKVFVDRELDQVPSQSELSGGGHDG